MADNSPFFKYSSAAFNVAHRVWSTLMAKAQHAKRNGRPIGPRQRDRLARAECVYARSKTPVHFA